MSRYCRECYDDPCTCEPEPLQDFENGYVNELAPAYAGWMDWRDRANMRVLTWRDLVRLRYDTDHEFERIGQKLMDISMRSSPLIAMLDKGAIATYSNQGGWLRPKPEPVCFHFRGARIPFRDP
jgi:hypothetical protein